MRATKTNQPAPAVTITGDLHTIQTHPDGSVTLRPGPGTLTVTTGQTRPEPTTAAEPRPGCECAAVTTAVPEHAADTIQAGAISRHLATAFKIASGRLAVGFDHDHQAAAVRVATPHGLYALLIPAVGDHFPIHWQGRRVGMLSVRRVPGTSDETVGTLFAAFLRDRGDL